MRDLPVMFIRKTKNNGQDYLSTTKKYKDSDGKWKVKYICSLGSVKKLETIFPDPINFFNQILHKILENIDSSQDEEDEAIPFHRLQNL